MMTNKSGLSVGILTALVAPELVGVQSVLAAMGWAQQVSHPSQTAAGVKEYSKNGINLFTGTIGQAGQAPAAVETLMFLERCRLAPTIVFLCGIAGSLDPSRFKKQDVVISSSVHWKTPDKIEDGSPCHQFRWKTFPLAPYTVDTKNALEMQVHSLFPNMIYSTTSPFGIHFSDVYTGNYVVSSSTIVSKIRTDYPLAACVEMEAGGFVSALDRYSQVHGHRPVLGIVVRGISDYAEKKDKTTNDRKLASENAARVASMIAERVLDPRFPDLLLALSGQLNTPVLSI